MIANDIDIDIDIDEINIDSTIVQNEISLKLDNTEQFFPTWGQNEEK